MIRLDQQNGMAGGVLHLFSFSPALVRATTFPRIYWQHTHLTLRERYEKGA